MKKVSYSKESRQACCNFFGIKEVTLYLWIKDKNNLNHKLAITMLNELDLAKKNALENAHSEVLNIWKEKLSFLNLKRIPRSRKRATTK